MTKCRHQYDWKNKERKFFFQIKQAVAQIKGVDERHDMEHKKQDEKDGWPILRQSIEEISLFEGGECN